MTDDVSRLAALAQAARPGWEHIRFTVTNWTTFKSQAAALAFLKACTPDAVLALIRERDDARAEVESLLRERAETRQAAYDDKDNAQTMLRDAWRVAKDAETDLQALRDRITALADELGRVASATLAGGGGIASLPAREAEMHLRKLVPTPPAEVKHGWDAVDVGAIKAAGRAVVESVRPAPPAEDDA